MMHDKERFTFRGISSVLAILLFLLYGIEKIDSRNREQEVVNTILTLEDQKHNFEVQADSLGRVTAKQEVLLIDARADYASLLQDFQNLKKTKSQTRVITETRIDSVFVPTMIVDTVFVDKEAFPVYSFDKEDEYFQIKARVSPTESLIEKITFQNDITFSHRWERKNFLSKKTYFVEVNNSNPYVNIQGLQNYSIEEQKPFYEHGKFWFIVGGGVGFLIAK
jgi:hypothetical protein